MVAFCRDVVGFQLEWDDSDPSVIVELDGLRFGRRDFESLTNQAYTYPSGHNGTFELALDVDTPEDVDWEYQRMVPLSLSLRLPMGHPQLLCCRPGG